MIEKTLYDFLTASLTAASIPVYTEIPKDRPEKFVTLERTGGTRSNYIETATMAFQMWAPTLYEAASLCETVKAIVDASIALPDIAAVELVSNGNFTDQSTKTYRYQAVYNITHY